MNISLIFVYGLLFLIEQSVEIQLDLKVYENILENRTVHIHANQEIVFDYSQSSLQELIYSIEIIKLQENNLQKQTKMGHPIDVNVPDLFCSVIDREIILKRQEGYMDFSEKIDFSDLKTVSLKMLNKEVIRTAFLLSKQLDLIQFNISDDGTIQQVGKIEFQKIKPSNINFFNVVKDYGFSKVLLSKNKIFVVHKLICYSVVLNDVNLILESQVNINTNYMQQPEGISNANSFDDLILVSSSNGTQFYQVQNNGIIILRQNFNQEQLIDNFNIQVDSLYKMNITGIDFYRTSDKATFFILDIKLGLLVYSINPITLNLQNEITQMRINISGGFELQRKDQLLIIAGYNTSILNGLNYFIAEIFIDIANNQVYQNTFVYQRNQISHINIGYRYYFVLNSDGAHYIVPNSIPHSLFPKINPINYIKQFTSDGISQIEFFNDEALDEGPPKLLIAGPSGLLIRTMEESSYFILCRTSEFAKPMTQKYLITVVARDCEQKRSIEDISPFNVCKLTQQVEIQILRRQENKSWVIGLGIGLGMFLFLVIILFIIGYKRYYLKKKYLEQEIKKYVPMDDGQKENFDKNQSEKSLGIGIELQQSI